MDVSESSPAIHQLRRRSAQKPQLSPVTVRQFGNNIPITLCGSSQARHLCSVKPAKLLSPARASMSLSIQKGFFERLWPGAPYYFHTVVGGGHNPYFGLKFDASGSSFNSGGGGIGLFEDPIVEPLIKAFLHHYLLDRRKDLFTGVDVTQSEGHCRVCPK